MPLLSQAISLDEAQEGVAIRLRQGDTPELQFTVRTQGGQAVDLAQWSFSVNSVEAYTGKVAEMQKDALGDDVLVQLNAPDELVPDATATVAPPRVEKAVQTGVYFVTFPADFWSGEMRLMPNAMYSPVVLMMLAVRRPTGEIKNIPLQVVVLYGVQE